MPEIRGELHLEELHVAMDDTVHIVNREMGILQGVDDRLLNHFHLVLIFLMRGQAGLADADNRDVSVLFVFLHRQHLLMPQELKRSETVRLLRLWNVQQRS